MNAEEFAGKIRTALGDNLVSFTIYGSAATGEASKLYSDVNTLIVARDLGMETLKQLSEPVKAWMKKGQPAPTLFTANRLMRSADVFPIEIYDMQERHRVVFGEDTLADLVVDARNLRFQVEHELKGKLLQLRSAYLATGNKPKRIAELLARSVSTFQLLCRATLRLYAPTEPSSKLEAARRLSAYVSFDVEALEQAQSLKDGSKRYQDIDCESLFARVLAAVGTVADAVDSLETSAG